MALTSRCQYWNCKVPSNLMLCSSCKVTPYCSRSHQSADHQFHEYNCKAVQRTIGHHDCLEKRQRNRGRHNDIACLSPRQLDCYGERHLYCFEQCIRNFSEGSIIVSASPIEDHVDQFWKCSGALDYLVARIAALGYMEALNTYEAVHAASEHARVILRLTRSGLGGTWDKFPTLLMRLGRDQEAYDALKWYATVNPRDDYQWTPDNRGNKDRNDPSLPFLDIKNADAFEPVDYMNFVQLSLHQIANITLLKFKLLLDIERLANTYVLEEITPSLPVDIIEMIRYHVVSGDIFRTKIRIMTTEKIFHLKERLTTQCYGLFMDVHRANEYFWETLIRGGSPWEGWEGYLRDYPVASKDEAIMTFIRVGDAWRETPGVLTPVRRMYEMAGLSPAACSEFSADGLAALKLV